MGSIYLIIIYDRMGLLVYQNHERTATRFPLSSIRVDCLYVIGSHAHNSTPGHGIWAMASLFLVAFRRLNQL